jgi:tellurite resistance-related uncharacterized protein
MKQLPQNVVAYRQVGPFTETTVPKGLLRDHTTADGVWALIQVEDGQLEYIIGDDKTHLLSPGLYGVIEPQALHRVRPIGHVSFFVEFYR